MSMRIRQVEGSVIALCAVETDEEPGDLYLDDDVHHALANKFARDWDGETVNWRCDVHDRLAETQKLRDAFEEHERWERAGRPENFS